MARLIDPFEQFFDTNGEPLVNGLLYFFETGSSTVVKPTYADSAMSILNTNPVILNGDGRCPNIFGEGAYRVILATSDDIQLVVRDPVGGDNNLGFGSDWDQEVIYSTNDVVYESGSYWVSLSNNNQNNRPSTDGGVNWVVANFGSGAPSNAPVFNHTDGPDSDVLLTNNDTVHPLVYRLNTQGAAFGFNGAAWFYGGDDSFQELKAQVTYPTTSQNFFGAADKGFKLVGNLSAGWAGRAEWNFGYDGGTSTALPGTLSTAGGATFNGTAQSEDFSGTLRNIGRANTLNTFNVAHTLDASDANATVYTATGGVKTYTIPLDSTTAFPSGTIIQLINDDGSVLNLSGAVGVEIRWLVGGSQMTGNRTIAANSVVCITKTPTANTWILTGNGIS